MKAEVTGIEEANKRLNDEVKKLGRLSERFVTKAMISISAQTVPMIPIDTGFLVNSEFRKVRQVSDGFEGEIGYGAEYAAAVHDSDGYAKGKGIPRDPEDPSRGDYWDPDAEPRFLEKGLEAFIEDELDALIRKELGE